mmetsp:Transcript_47812/g.95455  ORF Transcript_47812/g.95455 Transcript_47812/m.95455 type:complete len:257 (-) Transcript_47812:358-1128(-)
MGYSPTMCSSSREALFISGKFTTIILSAPLSTTLMLDRVNQERTHAEYLRHLYQTARKSKEEQKEGFKQLHAEMTQDLGAARSAKDQAEARHDELKHEMRLLEEKYQEETRKVRILQERMVDWKRKSGERMTPDHTPIAHCTPCSPSNPSSSALRQREPSPLHASLQSVPRCGLNATVHRGLGGRLASPAPHRSTFEAPRLGRTGFGSGLGSGSSASISRLAPSYQSVASAPTSRQPTPTRHQFGQGSFGSLTGRR